MFNQTEKREGETNEKFQERLTTEIMNTEYQK